MLSRHPFSGEGRGFKTRARRLSVEKCYTMPEREVNHDIYCGMAGRRCWGALKGVSSAYCLPAWGECWRSCSRSTAPIWGKDLARNIQPRTWHKAKKSVLTLLLTRHTTENSSFLLRPVRGFNPNPPLPTFAFCYEIALF